MDSSRKKRYLDHASTSKSQAHETCLLSASVMPSQQKKKQPARDLPPIAPDQRPSTRRNTRSRVSAEPSEVSQPVALGKSKGEPLLQCDYDSRLIGGMPGKRKAQQSLMRPSKRANARKSPETQSESTANNVKERNLQIADVADAAGSEFCDPPYQFSSLSRL